MALFEYQEQALARTDGRDRCAFYHDMGLGKTYTGAEKMSRLGHGLNLVVCQANKVGDWLDHFRKVHPDFAVYNLRNTIKSGCKVTEEFLSRKSKRVGVVNYETLIYRPAIVNASFGCVMFDESSMLQNPGSRRTKAAMRLAENASSLILLSGTPTDGKYERLWTQLSMLGWNISERTFWNHYVDYKVDRSQGFPIRTVEGYKNEERLASKMAGLGCDFLKTEDVLDLPEQRFIAVRVRRTREYARFAEDKVLEAFGTTFVGDTTFGEISCSRRLASAYSKRKLEAFREIAESTGDRLVVFYNFNEELTALEEVLEDLGRPFSTLNGESKDLAEFRENEDGIALVQYQSGAMGVNMQEAQYCVYFSPPLASSLYEQSKKRIHRVGQTKPCTYYNLISTGTVEEAIYGNLAMRLDYTEQMFERSKSC